MTRWLFAPCAAFVFACRPEPLPPAPPAPPASPTTSVASAAPEVDAAPTLLGEPQGSFLTNAAVTTSGVPDAEEVILGLRPSFKRCYEATRAGGAHFGGMVTCSLRVDKDGKVAAVSITRRYHFPEPMLD